MATHGRVYLPKILSDEFGLSTSEARRLISQCGVKVDGECVTDHDPPAASLVGKTITVGKRRSMKFGQVTPDA